MNHRKSEDKMFANLWKNTKDYFKINAVALLVIGLVFVLMVVLFLPHEKKMDEELAKKFNAISQQYNEKTGDYKNIGEVVKLQNEASGIQNDNKIVKLLKVVIISTFLGVITSLLAWLMQFLFTTIKFTKINEAETVDNVSLYKGDPMRVLTAALWTATAIVCVVFVVIYSA